MNLFYARHINQRFDCDFSDRSFSFHDFGLVFEAVVACTVSPDLFSELDNCPVSEINVLVSSASVVLLRCKHLYWSSSYDTTVQFHIQDNDQIY